MAPEEPIRRRDVLGAAAAAAAAAAASAPLGAAALLAQAGGTRAQRAAAAASPAPPFLGHGAHNLLVRYRADGGAVRDLLPPGLEPASDVVTLNMYTVAHGLGFPPYTRTYVWADVEGFDAWDGTKGRYVLVGWAEPQGFRDLATGLLRWPAEPGATRLEGDGAAGGIRATLAVGGEDLVVARARFRDPGAAGAVSSNLLPYLFVDAAEAAGGGGAGVGTNLVPFAGRVREAEPVSVEFRVPDAHPLARLRPKRLVGAAEVRDGSLALGVIALPRAGVAAGALAKPP